MDPSINMRSHNGSHGPRSTTEKQWSQSLKPNSSAGMKPEKRSALGEVSNTVKPRSGNGASQSIKPKLPVSIAQPLAPSKSQAQSRLSSSISGQPRKSLAPTLGRQPLSRGSSGNGIGLGLKTKPSSTSTSSSVSLFQESNVEVTVKPNLLVHTDPEQTREVKEMSDSGLVPNKGFYLTTPIFAADSEDIEDRDENYLEPEQMGHSDEFYFMRPTEEDREFADPVIPEDVDQYFPGLEILDGNENMMTIAEEIEISLGDLIDSDSEEDDDEHEEVSEGGIGPQ